MDHHIHFNGAVSLKQIALVRVAGYLWDDEISLVVDNPSYCDLLLNVNKEVCQLKLPELVKQRLLELNMHMSEKLWNLSCELQKALKVRGIVVRKTVCTQLGLLDEQKTVELFLKGNQTLDIEKQFLLACRYCIVDQIRPLLSKLSLEQIKSMESEFCYYKDELELFFPKIILLKDSYVDAFRDAASKANIVRVKYFLQKLSSSERESNLVKTTVHLANRASTPEDNDFVCHLLQQMNTAEQDEIFRKFPENVLACFLHWPWHVYFMELANCMWDVLVEHAFHDMLVTLVRERRNFFKEFWSKSPEGHKKFVINDNVLFCDILGQLIAMGDMQNTMLVLDSANNDERQDAILSHVGAEMCEDLASCGSWNELKKLLSKCFYSKEKFLEFKAKFESLDVFEDYSDLDTWNRIVSELCEMLDTSNVAASRRNDQNDISIFDIIEICHFFRRL